MLAGAVALPGCATPHAHSVVGVVLHHYSVKQGLPDEQIVWASYWLPSVHGSDDKDSREEARNILRGNSVPESWGWTPPEEPEPAQPRAPEPAAGPAAEPDTPEPDVVPRVPREPVTPAGSGFDGPAKAPAVTNGKEQVQSPAATEQESAAQGPGQAEEGLMVQCRTLLADMASSVGKLQSQRAVLAKLATPGDRAQMRGIAKALRELERELERALEPAGV